VQPIALAVLAFAAIIIAIVCALLYKRIARLLDGAQETLASVNRVAVGLEGLIDEAEKELATIRGVTERLSRVSARIEALAEDAADTIEGILQPVKRISKTIGSLKAAIAGVVAGAAVLRRPRGVPHEPQEEPTPSRLQVGERSAP
jgi:uncharacterized protein YoxC